MVWAIPCGCPAPMPQKKLNCHSRRKLTRATYNQFRWQQNALRWSVITLKACEEQLCCLSAHLGWIMGNHGDRHWQHFGQLKIVEANKCYSVYMGAQGVQSCDTDTIVGRKKC